MGAKSEKSKEVINTPSIDKKSHPFADGCFAFRESIKETLLVRLSIGVDFCNMYPNPPRLLKLAIRKLVTTSLQYMTALRPFRLPRAMEVKNIAALLQIRRFHVIMLKMMAALLRSAVPSRESASYRRS